MKPARDVSPRTDEARWGFPRGTLIFLSMVAGAPAWIGCSSDDGSATGKPTEQEQTVSVTYDGDTVEVALAERKTTTVKDLKVVSLESLWDAAGFDVALSSVSMEFEGDDGFRPSQKDKCAEPLAGDTLLSGYVTPDTRNLVWDDALGLPECYSVSGVARLEARDLAK